MHTLGYCLDVNDKTNRLMAKKTVLEQNDTFLEIKKSFDNRCEFRKTNPCWESTSPQKFTLKREHLYAHYQ